MHTRDVVSLFKLADVLAVVYITVISLLAVRTASKLSGDRSAVNVLAGAVAKVVSLHWKRLLDELDFLAESPAHYKQLQIAHEYLSIRGSDVYVLENERNLSNLRDAPPADREEKKIRAPQVPTALQEAALLAVFLVGSAVVVRVIIGLLILLREYPEIILPIAFVLSIVAWVTTRPSPPKVEYVPVTGLASDWPQYQPRSWKDFNQERQAVFMAIVNKEEGGGVGGDATMADLEAAKKTPLPAPPGITELALSTA